MKKLFLLLGLLLSMSAAGQTNEKPFVVPELTAWQGGTGRQTPGGRIVVKSKAARGVAEALREDYRLLTGRRLTLATGRVENGDIVLSLRKHDRMGAEGYELNVGQTIDLSSPSLRGLYWATRTLLQMSEQGAALPKGRIIDEPQYALRGFMLDVGRKFIPMHYLRNLVKIMAYYKMNTLQLHLNDNGFKQYFGGDWARTSAAFRLECDTYPGLAAADGYYTKQEFIDLQRLAEQCGVDIIPEIDAPAHVLAFTHYRPGLGSKEFGMDHFDLSNPEVYTFMDALFEEYVGGKEPVFRGKRVNIGTDEYSNATKELVEQFRAFTDHYLALMQRHGKQPMIWGSLSHARGDTPVRHEGVLMSLWSNDYAQPEEMKRLGYQLVSMPDGLLYIVPAAGYYYDYLDCAYLYKDWTPAQVGRVRFEEQDPQLEGAMFAVWNDHYGNGISTKDIHHRLFPAMQTVAVKCWTGRKTSLPWSEFSFRSGQLSEAPGVNELGRLPRGGLSLPEVKAGEPLALPLQDAGYGQSVSFDIDCRPEERGTVLTRSSYATFYLADPEQGKVGFARDGYLNTFNYRLPEEGKVSLRIVSTNKATTLFVDGKQRQELGIQSVFGAPESSRLQTMPGAKFVPEVYKENVRMNYVQTLMFPLGQAGQFKSRVSNLRVKDKD